MRMGISILSMMLYFFLIMFIKCVNLKIYGHLCIFFMYYVVWCCGMFPLVLFAVGVVSLYFFHFDYAVEIWGIDSVSYWSGVLAGFAGY